MNAMPDTPDSSSSYAGLKFETALAELEALIQSMESGKLELDASLAAYQRGMALLRHCEAQLRAAEQQIEIMATATPEDTA
ncbi:MAG: exodeoxyribonuclease VII small subunit [Azovibrio sp.]|nr:exodeoxyribonuclease VII small subunit [Azovibrio sp.]